jgi:CDP-glycerol glycerophosphotransferase (TagB/SpsB family)
LKILILNNFFNKSSQYSFRIIRKGLLTYQRIKLFNLLDKLRNEYNKDFEIEIINYNENELNIKELKKVSSLSAYRTKLSKKEYLSIVKKIKSNTKNININFLNNLNKLKVFNIGGIQFSDLLEIHLIRFFNLYSGEIELIKKIITTSKFDKIILYNCNPYFLAFFQEINKKNKIIEIYNDKISWYVERILRTWTFIWNLIRKLGNDLIGRGKRLVPCKSKKNIILIANSKNHLNSVEPIYRELKKSKKINPILYSQKYYLSLFNLTNYFRFLGQTSRNWIKYHKKICSNIGIYSNLMNFFFVKELPILFTIIFNEYQNISKIIRQVNPLLVSISNQFRVESKLVEKYCKLKNIPTIYIPHAGVPMVGEVVCKKDFSYLIMWGEYDINYYLNLGMDRNKLIITGNPRFEHFYKNEIDKLKGVKDMFSNRIYQFNSKSKTILLATSPYDDASKEKLIKTVINSLKKINLLDNLIIKLHPAESGLIQKHIVKNLKVNPIIIRDYNLLELIKSCDIVISSISSLILETMIIGTPIILADFINLGFMYIQTYAFTDEKFIKVAVTEDSLTKTIKELIENEDKFLEYSKKIKESSKLFSFYDENDPPIKKIINLILKNIN